MLSHAELVAFIATAQPERALSFYRDTLGLRLVTDDPFALVFDAAGTMLRVQKVPSLAPHGFTALGWKTADIVASAERLLERGVRCERYPHFEQDALGIWNAPSGARVAWFEDPDGNTLSLTQF